MKSSSKDQAKGLFHQVKGSAKVAAGKMSGSSKLKAEGAVEKVVGKVQKRVGKVKKALGS